MRPHRRPGCADDKAPVILGGGLLIAFVKDSCATGNVAGDFAQLDRLALDQADDNPHPDREPFEMQCRMECLEIGGDAVV